MSTDPWQLLGTARTVLAVHAHPDDESLSTGALLAALAADGTRVVLVTATRGEEGEIVPGAVPTGTSAPSEIRGRRSTRDRRAGDPERHDAARARGRRHCRYRDSGMAWVREARRPLLDAGDGFSLLPLSGADDLVPSSSSPVGRADRL